MVSGRVFRLLKDALRGLECGREKVGDVLFRMRFHPRLDDAVANVAAQAPGRFRIDDGSCRRGVDEFCDVDFGGCE